MPQLRDGSQVSDPRLDRIYQEDWRSLNYLIRGVVDIPSGLPIGDHKPRSYTWRCNVWMDQGVEGACVSTGCGHELAAYPVEVLDVNFPWCRDHIYWEAQKIDEWEGGEYPGASPRYSGTSVLAGLKILERMGFINGYTWSVTLKEAVLGLGYHGPGIAGLNWYTGMFDTDADGFIHPTGNIEGGHCLLAVAVKLVYNRASWWGWWKRTWEDVDLDRSYIVLHNSWGRVWGQGGEAKITLRDFGKLLNEQGELAFVSRDATRRSIHDAILAA